MATEKAKKGHSKKQHSHRPIAIQAIKEEFIGITDTNTRPVVAPVFGTEIMRDTNPLTFAH